MSSTFFGFFDKVFIVLLDKVYIVVLCKCVTKCRGKRWKHTASPFSQRGLLGNCVLDNNFLIYYRTPPQQGKGLRLLLVRRCDSGRR